MFGQRPSQVAGATVDIVIVVVVIVGSSNEVAATVDCEITKSETTNNLSR